MSVASGETIGTVMPTQDRALPQGELAEILLSYLSVSAESIIITDADCVHEDGPVIRFANAATLDYTGYAVHGLAGRRLGVLYAPETMRSILADMREANLTGRAVIRELPVLSMNGRQNWVEISAVPVIDAAGKVTHFIRSGRNVTARRRAEMQRESSERLLASVLGVTREAMIVIATTGHVALANNAFSRRFGWHGADLDAMQLQDQLVGSNPDRVMSEITHAAPGLTRQVMANIRHKDGSTIPCLLIVNPVSQADDRLYYVLIVQPEAATHGAIAFEAPSKPAAVNHDAMLDLVLDRYGASSFLCLLHPPQEIRERHDKARGVMIDEHGKLVDPDLVMLRWAADEAAREEAAGGPRYFGIMIDHAIFDSKMRHGAFFDFCRKLSPGQCSRIVMILRHVPAYTTRERLGSLIRSIKPYARRVGFEHTELGGMLGGARHEATIVTIAAERLLDDPQMMERLDKIAVQIHMEGARLLVHRIPAGADCDRFLQAGVDLVAGEGVKILDTPVPH